MANYFQDPSQTFVPTPVYRPPFEAIQSTLIGKQQKYDSALSNIQSIHNSIFNAPLTKGENAQARLQFLNSADNTLKNLSQVDLSIESNQNQARNVFAPFFKDNDIQADMVYTSQQGEEVNKFNTFKPDADSEEYADMRNLSNIQNGINQVKNSKRGDMSVYNVRKFVPYRNLMKDAVKTAKDAGFVVKSWVDNGTTMYQTTNGAGSIGNWRTFLEGMTDDRYNNQFADEALYAKEEGIKREKYKYAVENNGAVLDDQSALSNYVSSMFGAIKKTNLDAQGQWKENKTAVELQIDKLKKSPDVTKTLDENKKLMMDLKATDDEIDKKISFYGEAANKFDPKSDDYKDTFHSWLTNPDENFYGQVRNQNIQNVANALSQNEQKSLPVANPVFDQAHKLQQEGFENQLKYEDARNKTRAAEDTHIDAEDTHNQKVYNLAHPKVGKNSDGSGGDGNPDYPAVTTSNPNGLTMVGLDNTQPQKVDSKQNFDSQMGMAIANGIAPMISVDDIGGTALTRYGGLKYDYLRPLFTAIQDGKKYENFTPEEKKVANRVKGALKASNVDLKGYDQWSFARAIHDYAAKNLENDPMDHSNNAIYQKLTTGLNFSEDGFNKSMDLNTARSNATAVALKNHPKISPYIKDTDGSKSLKTADDLAKELPDIKMDNSGFINTPTSIGILGVGDTGIQHLFGGDSGMVTYSSYKSVINKKDFAKGFMDGTIKIQSNITSSHTYSPGLAMSSAVSDTGLTVTNTVTGGTSIVYPGDAEYATLKAFKDKYGDVSKFKDTQNILNKEVYPKIPMEIGEMGMLFHQPLVEGKLKGSEPALSTIREIGAPGNHSLVKLNGNEVDKDGGVANFVTNLSSMSSADMHKYLPGVDIHQMGSDGLTSITIKLNPLSSAEEEQFKKQYNLSGDDIQSMQNKGIELTINPDTKSPALQSLTHSFGTGVYINDQLLRGRTVSSSPLLKSTLGMEYHIIPNRTNNPTTVRVEGNSYVVDPITGAGKWIAFKHLSFQLNNINPDEISNQLKALAIGNFNNNQTILKNIEALNPALGKAKEDQSAALTDYYNQLTKNK